MVCTSDSATGQRGHQQALVESSSALYGDLPAEARGVNLNAPHPLFSPAELQHIAPQKNKALPTSQGPRRSAPSVDAVQLLSHTEGAGKQGIQRTQGWKLSKQIKLAF